MCDSPECGACWNGLPTLYTRAVAGVQESERPILAAEMAWKGGRLVGNPNVRTGLGDGSMGEPWDGRTTATTKYFYMYVFIAVVVVCCGEVGMRGETAWKLAARAVPDFQIRTIQMWGLRRTGGLGQGSGPDLQRHPHAGTRDAQCRFRGWVEMQAIAAFGAAMREIGFPPAVS
jgi:hypothetical protein